MKKLLSGLPFFCFMICTLVASAQEAIDHEKAADSFYKQKDYKQALDNYTMAIEANQHNKLKLPVLYDKRAQSESDLELYQKAIDDESKAIGLNPQFGDAYWNRAIAYHRIKEYQMAIDDYTKAIPFNKDDTENLSTLYDNIGLNERKLKHYKNAIDDYTKAIALNGQNGDAFWHRGTAYNNNGDYQLAIDDYTTAMFYNQNNVEDLSTLYDNRGTNERLLKQYTKAINDFNTAINLNPKQGDVYWHRGLAHDSNGDYLLAIDDYKQAMPYFQNDNENLGKLYNNCARNKIRLHQPEKAIDDLSQAISLSPKSGFIYWSRGIAYSTSGQPQLAIDDYTKTMEYYKDNKKDLAILYNNRASNEYTINETKKALMDCSLAILLDPTFASTYYTRAKIYLKKLDDKESATKDFNKAMELDTEKKSAGYVFGFFYTGKTELAVKTMQEKIVNTTNADDLLGDYYNMACLLSLMNKPGEANVYLKKAIDSGYSKKYATLDEDLDNIRQTDDYKATMAEAVK